MSVVVSASIWTQEGKRKNILQSIAHYFFEYFESTLGVEFSTLQALAQVSESLCNHVTRFALVGGEVDMDLRLALKPYPNIKHLILKC
jgi:hypothetical protein